MRDYRIAVREIAIVRWIGDLGSTMVGDFREGAEREYDVFNGDDQELRKPGVVRSIYDPTAGTGGMLSVADEHLTSVNPQSRLVMYGPELNPESYAICKADMLIKG